MAKRAEVQDPMWWGGTPIWTLIERAGHASAPLFWPGSEAPHDGIRPRYWQPRDENRPAVARLDQLFQWLDLPARAAAGIPDGLLRGCRRRGPRLWSGLAEVRDAIARDDGYIGQLVSGLTRRGILDRVNVVVVSDHGMAALDDARVIVADDFISPDDVFISDINPTLGLFPKPGKDEEVLPPRVGRERAPESLPPRRDAGALALSRSSTRPADYWRCRRRVAGAATRDRRRHQGAGRSSRSEAPTATIRS